MWLELRPLRDDDRCLVDKDTQHRGWKNPSPTKQELSVFIQDSPGQEPLALRTQAHQFLESWLHGAGGVVRQIYCRLDATFSRTTQIPSLSFHAHQMYFLV